MQETSLSSNLPGSTSTNYGQRTEPVSTSSAGPGNISVGPSSTLPNNRRSSSTGTIPAPSGDAGAALFNAPLPEGELPLKPKITPGWAVAGTILLGTGLAHVLFSAGAKRVHTFFGAAFLAALGTTVLILYLMTTPASLAVQGAFVVATVFTGAALGGIAALFSDLAECLACILGGFSLGMWLLTLHPGGLVRHGAGKAVFIAIFSLVGLCLYFSRWTRAYGLVVCISISGATAVVLGIDCFSRAGLKEFWAYIWELNETLFPEDTVTYPLTRGIRVELAITILLSVVGIVSQLKLWQPIQNRRNKPKDETSDEELGLPDEEEKIGRQVEEVTNRERREWERVYGEDGGIHYGSADSAVGGMEGEKAEGHSQRPSVGLSGGEQSGGSSVEVHHQEQSIIEQFAAGGSVTVRVVEDDVAGGEATDISAQANGDDGLSDTSTDPAASPSSQPGPEPLIFPLPFRDPAAWDGKDTKAQVVDVGDRSSIAAVAGEDEQPCALLADTEDILPPKHQAGCRMGSSQSATISNLEEYVGEERYGVLVLPTNAVRDDSDSVIANMDDESTSGKAETAVLDWTLRWSYRSLPSDSDDEKHQETEALRQQTTTPHSTDDAGESGSGSPPLGDTHRLARAESLSSSTRRSPDEILNTVRQKQAVSDVAPHLLGDSELGSTTSFRAFVAPLTTLNLPPALPDVALTYRTNEWAKHLSIAERPDPEVLRLPEPVPEAPNEEPAHLDIVGLQQTAETGAPPPAAPKASTTVSNYPPHATSESTSSTLLSDSEMAMSNPSPASQPGTRPPQHRPIPATLKRHSTRFPVDSMIEKHGDSRRDSALRQGLAQTQSAGSSVHRRSTSASTMSTPDRPHKVYPQTKHPNVIGMRENLLRSRASGILTPISGNAFQTPPDPSTAHYAPADPGRAYGYPVRSPTPSSQYRSSTNRRASADIDLDDVPLSQRRSIIRHHQTRTATNLRPTAHSTTFDSHQPRRGTSAIPPIIRHAQLASFRNSVAVDLRPSSPPSVSELRRMSSTAALLDPHGSPALANTAALGVAGVTKPRPTADRNRSEAMRSIDLQRGYLLVEKAAEVRRREAEAAGRVQFQREFEELMRSGVLMDAHRDAMRRLQGGVRG
ncbi:hypothetical protein B0I37DRAFT_408734 [Chaetomium sp. MPI-CAGE-AT-0009]|nr:hypothetical protein B0I37DRAFT_408734 [Chaetomium sp. MPI-CAGE-AT-0009]